MPELLGDGGGAGCGQECPHHLADFEIGDEGEVVGGEAGEGGAGGVNFEDADAFADEDVVEPQEGEA